MKINITNSSKENIERIKKDFPNGRYLVLPNVAVYWVFEIEKEKIISAQEILEG